MELVIQKTGELKPKPDQTKLGFGQIFTDYMLVMDYSGEKGWHDPRIRPYGSFSMDPSTMVLHYGQAAFEGLKAYRTRDGKIQLFRPRKNFERLNNSNRILCIPEMDEDFLLSSLKKLLETEKEWVPGEPGTSLYIRPTVIATDNFLGVRASDTYRYYVILSPVGAYYPEGFNPVKIWVTSQFVRTVPGGMGEAKTAGNYAASLFAGQRAAENGYTQVLWLDGVSHEYVEEVGAMNIFFAIDGELHTPELTGSILPGVTRDSVIQLAGKWGIPCNERRIRIDEVADMLRRGKSLEIFGTGTAAVISPVGLIKYKDEVLTVNDNKVGELTRRFYDSLTGIQYGTLEDPFDWVEPVC